MDSVDRTVRSLYSGGAKIYLQLLLHSDAEGVYDIPEIFSFSVAKEIYSYCDFLSSRYSSYKNGFIDGVIIGKNLDDTEKYNNNRYGDDEKYTRALALYGVVAGVAVRKNIPYADIAYSFTNANTYDGEYAEEYASGLQPSYMIEKISGYFDSFYSEGFDFSIVLESSHLPLSISNENLNDGINAAHKYDGRYITEQNADVFANFLDSPEKKYSSAPTSFIYVWNADGELRGNALSCAYAYLYYKMFAQQRLSAFVIGFDDTSYAARDIINIIKYIDTDIGQDSTDQLLRFFGKNSWRSVISGFNSSSFAVRKHITVAAPESFSENMTGEFLYFDFSDFSSHNAWLAGRGFGGISIDYHKELGRSLRAEFNTDALSELEYAYLFNSYEYSENFTHTPYLTLTFVIEDNDEISDAFEFRVAFENDGNVYEAAQIVHTGEITEMHLDVSDFLSECVADNIRISLRPISVTSGDYKLFISSLGGESAELDDDELKTKIVEERLRIRDSLVDEDNTNNNQTTVIITILAILAAVILTVTLFFFLRKEDSEDEDE